MKKLLKDISTCSLCKEHLALGPNPVVSAHPESKLLIVGQAPGTKVHASGIPWDDASGVQLRKWLQLDSETFYDTSQVAIVPMGFCYPGKGKSGDLPPRKECAPQWHAPLLKSMPHIALGLLIGQYAQRYYLRENAMKNLTETVRNFQAYLPRYLPLPHPSPRNRFWLSQNLWFEAEVLPVLRERVGEVLQKK